MRVVFNTHAKAEAATEFFLIGLITLVSVIFIVISMYVNLIAGGIFLFVVLCIEFISIFWESMKVRQFGASTEVSFSRYPRLTHPFGNEVVFLEWNNWLYQMVREPIS